MAGCGPAPMSPEAYQRYVLDTLDGTPLQDDGLGRVLALTIGDLGCEGAVCTSRVRFQYLAQEPRARQPIVADYVGRVCKREGVRPPASHQAQHEALCEALDALFRSLDRVVFTASNGLRLGGDETETSNPSYVQVRQEVDARLTQERDALRQLQAALREIAWLRPIL